MWVYNKSLIMSISKSFSCLVFNKRRDFNRPVYELEYRLIVAYIDDMTSNSQYQSHQ